MRGTVTDAEITKADIEAGKTFTVTCTDFSLNDKFATAKALNMAMISTDIPFGLVEITDAKLFFDGKQVNVNGEGKDLFAVDIDKYSTLITFINIWQTSMKAFGYEIPTQSIKMEFTCTVKD